MAALREILLLSIGVIVFGSDIVWAQWQGPMFSQQPPARLVFSNASGSQVSCAAHGSPTPRVTWLLKDGSAVTAVPGLRQTLGNGTLYFPPFRAQDFRADVHEAVYRCRADNTVGSILSREVRVKAVISQHYDVQVYRAHVLTGNTAVLTCIIPAQVQDYVTVTSWYKDEHILLPGRSDVGGRYVVTSGTGELLIKSARSEDSLSRYSCLTLHSLTGERKRSQPATLTVTEPGGSSPPRLVQRSVTEMSAELGSDVHLSCAAQASPPPTFTWFRGTPSGGIETIIASPRVVPAQGLLHIRRVELSDAGRWLCEAQNAFGTQRVETSLAVTAPLGAHVQPRVQIVNSGGTAVFNCTISGAPVLSIEWYHDGRIITPDTRKRVMNSLQTLLVARVNREDRGMYQCALTNERDSATAAAELRLGDTVPELQHTFIEQALRPGPMVSLRCSATGTPPPQFSWLLDGRPLGDVMSGPRYAIGQFVDQSGDVVSHLNISGVRSEDGGHYTCRAANTLGSVDHSARVNIYGPPYVRSVGPFRAVARANLTLHCPYSGYPITSIKWERHGQDMLMDLRHRQDATQGGALLIANVDPASDAGAYTCTVHNRAGEQAKREILLEVVNPPLIEPFSFPQSVQQGGRTQVTCSVSSGDMPVYFSWTKDGQPLSSDLRIEERSADFFTMLIFKSITSYHSGAYTCTASNSAAKVNYTADLMVKVPPHWIVEPVDTSAHLGHTLDVHCSAGGFPDPVVTWLRQKHGDATEFETVPILDGRLSIQENGSLRIINSTPQDEGQFLCRAINGIGSGLSKMVNVQVNEPARFEVSYRNMSARRGDSVNLLCEVFGDQPIQVTWSRNGNRIELGSYRFSISEVQTTNGVSSQLSLNQADRQDSGTYQCQGENSFGRSNFFIHLAVQERPDPPVALEVVEVDGKSIKLSWRRPFDGNSPVLGFMIQYQPLANMGVRGLDWNSENVKNISLSSISTKLPGSGPREQAIVPNLHPSTTYALRMLAVNDIASSPFTEPVMAKTQEEAPSDAPPGLQVVAGGPEELIVTWQVPPRSVWNGELLGYAVQVSEAGSGNKTRAATVHGWASTKLNVKGLKKFTRYEVTVRAVNAVAAGPSTVPVIASTQEGVPEVPPGSVTCSPLSSQSLHVQWVPPPESHAGGIIQGYKVLYRPISAQLVETVEPSPGVGEVKRTSGTETYLHALQRFTNYSVQVLAYTSTGDGVASFPKSCHTEEDVPGPPSAIKALALSGDSVLVSWLAPVFPNGVLGLYTVYSRVAGRVGTQAAHPVRVDPGLDGSTQEEMSHEVRGLAEDGNYEFWVSATTGVGEGEPTSIVAQSTNTRAPARIASFSRVIKRPVGSSALLRCAAVGNPTPRAVWLHRSRPITFSQFYKITSDGHLQIHSVDQALAGNYTCSAKNLFGEDAITYTVEALLQPGQPVLELQYSTANSIKIRWTSPADGGTPLLGYTLSYRRSMDPWVYKDLNPEHTSHVLEDLKCGSSYQIYLVAQNSVGKGIPSETLNTRTKGNLSQMADEKQLLHTNATALLLRLQAWDDGGCPVAHFTVEYRPLGASRWQLVAAETSEPELQVGGLDTAAWYQLRITATNDAGTTAGSYNFATTDLNGEPILPPLAYPAGSDILEGESTYSDHIVIYTTISIILLICSAVLVLFIIRRNGICENEETVQMAEIKTNVERENLQNQKHVHETQQVYAPNPRKQSHGKLNTTAGEESEMYDISPYATFSVSGPESRSVTASTLDYTVQFKTFGMIEVEDGPDRIVNTQCGTPGKCGRHQMYPDDDSTLSKSMTLALGATTPHRSRNSQSQSGQTRSRKNHGSNSGKYKESESDTSGSPNREPYRVPVKPPRVFRQGSSTESNNETSPVLARRTPRHSKSSSTITDNPRFYERKKHQDLCTIYV